VRPSFETAQGRLLEIQDDGGVKSTGRNAMDIHLAGSRPTRQAPKEYFTGTVWQDPIIATAAPARIVSTRVSFEPGARTNWHSHPLGQTLYVISGVGRVQTKGEPVREIRPGDVVWIPPGEKHWHGGSPTNGMTHIAMQESLDGNYATWMEPVTDAEYAAKVGA
jgi:quercetin dioxygenase-like cupin family protein